MITLSASSPNTAALGTPEDRYTLMLAHLAFFSPATQQELSILCRILDGRDLDDVCETDAAVLPDHELAHYQSTLAHPRARALAIRTRAELRRMLSREIGQSPRQVPLRYDVHGKPYCPHPAAEGLAFSVSHDITCGMIALGDAVGIGVDVEKILTLDPAEELLDILFDQQELVAWSKLPRDYRPRAFTEAWTIKEAWLKAVGTGLDGSPHELTVRFDSHGHAWPVGLSSNCIFERVSFCPNYAASFVALMPGVDV